MFLCLLLLSSIVWRYNKMCDYFVIFVFHLTKFDWIVLLGWRNSRTFCRDSETLHADCVFGVLLHHADLKYLLCLHGETLWQLSSSVLHHVIDSPYRGIIRLSIFRISRHCTTLCTLCIYVCVMNYGWCSVVSIVPQLGVSALSTSQTNTQKVLLTWAEFSWRA